MRQLHRRVAAATVVLSCLIVAPLAGCTPSVTPTKITGYSLSGQLGSLQVTGRKCGELRGDWALTVSSNGQPSIGGQMIVRVEDKTLRGDFVFTGTNDGTPASVGGRASISGNGAKAGMAFEAGDPASPFNGRIGLKPITQSCKP